MRSSTLPARCATEEHDVAMKLTLFDLFGAPTIDAMLMRWPQAVRPQTGAEVNWPPVGLREWLQALNRGITIEDVRTGSLPDRVSIEAKMRLDNATAGYPEGFPFVLSSMPDVRFLVQHIASSVNARVFATISDAGTEIVIEG